MFVSVFASECGMIPRIAESVFFRRAEQSFHVFRVELYFFFIFCFPVRVSQRRGRILLLAHESIVHGIRLRGETIKLQVFILHLLADVELGTGRSAGFWMVLVVR